MALEDYLTYDGGEVINVARTFYRAQALGIPLRIKASRISALFDALNGGSEYSNASETPWYESGFPASEEFAGILPVSIQGLGDSTRQSSPTEYITDGGHTGLVRNSTASLVFSVVIVASTDRGADFGKRWLDKVLGHKNPGVFCSGAPIEYLRSAPHDRVPDLVHMNDVALTRGLSVTNKRRGSCQTFWWVQWTMTAGDPYEYGVAAPRVTSIGGAAASGPGVIDQGTLNLTQASCPAFDYSPIYDPLYPALVPSPTAPNFLPAGWGITNGMTFQRKWARITPVQPANLMAVPIVKITSTTEARMVRVSIWPGSSLTNDQCDPLFSAVLSYLPASLPVYLDAEQKASYAWDGASGAVRRTDSLVYSPTARPVQWTSFNDPNGMLVTIDFMAKTGGYQGDGNVRASLSLVPRTD